MLFCMLVPGPTKNPRVGYTSISKKYQKALSRQKAEGSEGIVLLEQSDSWKGPALRSGSMI